MDKSFIERVKKRSFEQVFKGNMKVVTNSNCSTDWVKSHVRAWWDYFIKNESKTLPDGSVISSARHVHTRLAALTPGLYKRIVSVKGEDVKVMASFVTEKNEEYETDAYELRNLIADLYLVQVLSHEIVYNLYSLVEDVSAIEHKQKEEENRKLVHVIKAESQQMLIQEQGKKLDKPNVDVILNEIAEEKVKEELDGIKKELSLDITLVRIGYMDEMGYGMILRYANNNYTIALATKEYSLSAVSEYFNLFKEEYKMISTTPAGTVIKPKVFYHASNEFVCDNGELYVAESTLTYVMKRTDSALPNYKAWGHLIGAILNKKYIETKE